MSRAPPFRPRPSLHLALTPLTGSPRHQSDQPATPMRYPSFSSDGTPLARTPYSPFKSIDLKSPSPFACRAPQTWRGMQTGFKAKRLCTNKAVWLCLFLLATMLWMIRGRNGRLRSTETKVDELGTEILDDRKMQDYQFFPASNPKIHYIGRWTSTPNRLRKDGMFPGVYFDLVIQNTTSLLLALHNANEIDDEMHSISTQSDALTSTVSPTTRPGHISFRPISAKNKPSPPISLLARIDDEEYVLLPNSSLLVTVCAHSLDGSREHHIRIVAPMIDGGGRGIVELEGLWLNQGGQLSRVPGSALGDEYANEDHPTAENEIVGERHRLGLADIERDGPTPSNTYGSHNEDEEALAAISGRGKTIEIVTDAPGFLSSKHHGTRTGGADGLLAGVTGWEYLLGEMFGADHVGIGVDGMCLTQDCIGGIGSPAGIGDAFFRSGPYGSAYFEHFWLFSAYVPDVMVLNIGESDSCSFTNHRAEYNKTAWDLAERFEATYVSLIKGIRRLAYPKHPAIVQSELSGFPGIIPSNTPGAIPIFVMRPLQGHLEQATQNVVAKLRADGDKSVFWLDTSGWLDTTEGSRDVFLDDKTAHRRWRLTEQGNQRVAIFLHMHVCRYLAGAEEKCAFLPHEVYQGKVFDPEEASFDRYLENEKERKLKKLFWGANAGTIEPYEAE